MIKGTCKCGCGNKIIEEEWNIGRRLVQNHIKMYKNMVAYDRSKEKICSWCGKVKNLTDFNCHSIYYYTNYCKQCGSISYKNKRFKRYYNITMTDAHDMWHLQKGKCAICGKKFKRKLSKDKGKNVDWSLDHDHKTGKARGLLCNLCNLYIGYIRESKEILKAAIKYLGKIQ